MRCALNISLSWFSYAIDNTCDLKTILLHLKLSTERNIRNYEQCS